jgi:hypothetical protein
MHAMVQAFVTVTQDDRSCQRTHDHRVPSRHPVNLDAPFDYLLFCMTHGTIGRVVLPHASIAVWVRTIVSGAIGATLRDHRILQGQ